MGGKAGVCAGDPLDPSARKAAGLGKSARRHLQRNQELLPQNLAGMHRLELLGHCRVPLLDHDPIRLNRIMISSLCLSMISNREIALAYSAHSIAFGLLRLRSPALA